MVRLDGKLIPLPYPPLTVPETKQLAYSVLTDAQKHRFEESLELDLSFGVKGLARFRANNFMQRGAVAGVYRQIPYEILGFRELGPAAGRRAAVRQAARPDPRHRPDRLRQDDDPGRDARQDQPREAAPHRHDRGPDRVPALAQEVPRQPARAARRHALLLATRCAPVLREDPDVVLIGEMRDLETIESALRIAETGHLTLATLHTNSATSSINRIIDVFPAHQQSADPHAALLRARGDHVPDAARALERQGARHGDGDPRPQRRHPQPDPRGQDPPDLLDDADRPVEVRHADLQPVARHAVPQEADHARGGALALLDARTSCRSSSTAAPASTWPTRRPPTAGKRN